ncbi:hypothetical protein [Pedobacter sp. SYP-B3415]|uniref:hypothetical protein n=1 Tax=Pedobacter sp. SYP-B3415 TaxID=2496641 RepID=UPI00101D675C|nr:hypothetical protein [Pedobacter sp. SYP-B3415]
MNRIVKASITADMVVENIGLMETMEGRAHREHKGIKCDWIAHEDLVNAFKALTPHVALICELPEAEGAGLEDEFESLTVKGFSIGGEEDHEGITITATRILVSGLTMNINTPFVKWTDGSYLHITDLASAAYQLQEEVNLYYQGKQAPKRQLEMFADEMEAELSLSDDGVEELAAEPKKRGRKKVTKIE